MGISAVGEKMGLKTARHLVATFLVMASLFYYLYGPPLTQGFSRAAQAECNDLTGENYRTFVLEWRTTSFASLDVPHWACTDTRDEGREVYSLGWWVNPF